MSGYDPDVDGTTPNFYGELDESNGHSLTAVDEGRLFYLTWKCRICGASRPITEEFEEIDCD